jgi:LPS-assembly lipoprotein
MIPLRALLCARMAALALAVALLNACGFKPVSTAALPFETLYVNAGGYNSFGGEFRRFVESNSRTTKVTDTPASADAILEILSERQEQQILSLSAKGTAQEYLLRYRVVFRLKDKAGRELIPRDTIVLERDLTYDADIVLAKENETAFLFRDMQMDAVQQLVRRLSLAKYEAPPVAPSGG